MNAVPLTVRLGIGRGLIEFRQMLTSRQDMAYVVVINSLFLLVLFLQYDSQIGGVSLAALTLPSLIGMIVVFGGVLDTATKLVVEREDGTLLRAKATPGGMIGYLVARITLTAIGSLLNLLILLVPSLVLLDELRGVGVAGWLTLVLVLALALLATLPWGAVIGSVVRTPGGTFGLTFLPLSGLVAISGIFYPITAIPGWLQGVAQVFPVYWAGLGVRSALLPDSAAAVELYESWRSLETFGVLALWAAAGLLVAPRLLRRMARRESGSAVAQRRQQVLQRVT